MTEAARVDVVIGAEIDKALRGFDTVQNRMSTFSQTALGMFAGGMLQRGLDAFTSTVTSGFDRAFTVVSDYEQQTMAMENLVARELKNGSDVTEVIGQRKRGLSQDEQEEYDALIGKLDEYGYKQEGVMLDVERARQRLAKADNPLEVSEAQHSLAGYERDYNELNNQISTATARQAELNAMRDQSVDITQTRQTLDQADALDMAGGRAKELLAWTQQLAIASPFDQKGVQAAMQMSMAYGFQSDEAQRLTQDTIDYAAGMGLGNEQITRVTRALGQMNQRGKVSAQELLQLTEAGFDAYGVLKLMGVTIDEVSSGTVSSETYIQTAMQMIERDFGGAAARSQETWNGMMNSLGDITDVGLRNLATPVLDAFKPLAVNVLGQLNTPEAMATLTGWGASIGSAVSTGIESAKDAWNKGKGWLFDLLGLNEPTPTDILLHPYLATEHVGLGDVFDGVQKYFQEHGKELPGIIEDWLVGGIGDAATAVSEWALGEESPLGTVAANIGGTVGAGIRSVFTNPTETGLLGSAIATFLQTAAMAGFQTFAAGMGAFEEGASGKQQSASTSLGGYFDYRMRQQQALWDNAGLGGTPGGSPLQGGGGIQMPAWLTNWWESSGLGAAWNVGIVPLDQALAGASGPGGVVANPAVTLNYYNYGVHEGTPDEMKAMIAPAFMALYREEKARE